MKNFLVLFFGQFNHSEAVLKKDSTDHHGRQRLILFCPSEETRTFLKSGLFGGLYPESQVAYMTDKCFDVQEHPLGTRELPLLTSVGPKNGSPHGLRGFSETPCSATRPSSAPNPNRGRSFLIGRGSGPSHQTPTSTETNRSPLHGLGKALSQVCSLVTCWPSVLVGLWSRPREAPSSVRGPRRLRRTGGWVGVV